MPIYEYKCSGCDELIEVLQKMSDDPLVDCPSCEGGKLTKKVSAAAFRLKGGGWYETDFKSGNKKNLAGGDGADSSGDNKTASGDGAKKDSDKKGGDSPSKSDSSSGKSSGSSTTSSSSAKDG